MDQPLPRCPACFTEGQNTLCPECGWQADQDNEAPCLPLGTLLDGRYQVGQILGHGGFGITYLGWDIHLKTRRAIKEFLPADLATRALSNTRVVIFTGEREKHFQFGLSCFLQEAELLARFEQHPGIVNVVSYFEANGTGYMVMEYLDGLTLHGYLVKQGGRIDIVTATTILMPVMDALRGVHKAGLLHRDIAPDNIHITRQGIVKLLDFGAARQNTQGKTKSLSVILKPGYAPEEQYRSHSPQGPYSDVYAVAATFYRAITGLTPPEALERRPHDPLEAPSRLGIQLTPRQEEIILKGLAPEVEQRYPTIEAIQQALQTANLGLVDPPTPPPDPPTPLDQHHTNREENKPTPKSKPISKYALVALTLVILASLGGYFYQYNQGQQTLRAQDDQAWQQAQAIHTVGGYRAYLENCDAVPCSHQSEAEQHIKTFKSAQQEAERQARDQVIWKAAEAMDSEQGYRAYLESCTANDCGFKVEAETRLANKIAARKERARRETEREARRQQDQVAWERAQTEDTIESYQSYLNNCTDNYCNYRHQARIRLTELEITRQFAVEETSRRAEEISGCRDGYLNSSQIQKLVSGRTAYGVRIGSYSETRWKEYQGSNGRAYFQKEGQSYISGRWKISNDAICWCYGDCQDYQCKRVWANADCTEFYYEEIDTGARTGRIYRWEEGDKTG